MRIVVCGRLLGFCVYWVCVVGVGYCVFVVVGDFSGIGCIFVVVVVE